jgi:L-threonylcarbamoyladenylate synthase
MQTKYIKLNEENFKESMEEAGKILKEGGLVGFPTETVYGLGGDALQATSSEKIYAAKGRPSDNPLIVHICELDDLYQIADQISEEAIALAKAFWPGPLTMILNKKECVPLETTGGLSTVAVRMPSHPAARALIKAGGGFIAAPSANTSGRPSPTKAEHVAEDLDGKIDMILDGGDVGIGLESTIVDLTEGKATILRPGYITAQMMEDVIGEVKMDPALMVVTGDQRPKAPGMKYRHYAPKAQMYLVKGENEAVIRKIMSLAEEAKKLGKKVGILCAKESEARYSYGVKECLGSRDNEEEIASNLFDVLRKFDHMDVDVIYSEWFDAPGIGLAVMNRMLKAAGHQIIQASEGEDI